MSTLELWIAFFGLMGVTLIARGFFLLLGAKWHISPATQEILRYAPTAALIAIVIPEVLFTKHAGSPVFEMHVFSPQLFGALTAIMAFLVTKSMLATICLGMLAFTACRFLM